VAKNQSKTLIPQSKNQIFQKFLSSFPKTSYERRATRNGYIFASKVQVALIIEGVFFYSLSLPEFIRVYPRVYLHGSSAGGVYLHGSSAGECVLTCFGVYPRELPPWPITGDRGPGAFWQKAASYLRAYKAQQAQIRDSQMANSK
jgi:hypothetical protein